MDERTKIQERLKEIDDEKERLHVTKSKVVKNWATGETKNHDYPVPTDPYRIRALRAEKRALLTLLDELSAKKAKEFMSTQSDSHAATDSQAVAWGAERYIELKHPTSSFESFQEQVGCKRNRRHVLFTSQGICA
jgi:hypothetical protein